MEKLLKMPPKFYREFFPCCLKKPLFLHIEYQLSCALSRDLNFIECLNGPPFYIQKLWEQVNWTHLLEA